MSKRPNSASREDRNRRYGTGRVSGPSQFQPANQNGRQSGHDWRQRSRSSNNNREERRHEENDIPPPSGSTHRKPPKPFNMSFKYVESLLQNDDLEFVMVTLINDRRGFKELLENVNVSNDMIILLVKLLSKMCASNFNESKIRVLQTAFNSEFIDNVTKFIATVAIQGKREKNSSQYFWNDPDEFWTNMMNICRNVHDLIPLTSYEQTFKILKSMKLSIPLIECSHKIHVLDEIKENIGNLHDVVEKASEEFQKKPTQNEFKIKQVELEPPDDFREISVYPCVEEIALRESPFLRPNIVQGPYRNIDQYLDIQFRLLREDFVAPLRNGICNYLNNSKKRLENIKIYHPVRFLKVETVNEQNCYRMQYDFSGKKKTFQYENSRRFIFGSLLCFTSNNFKSVIFGKIVQRDIKDLEQGQLIIGFDEDMEIPKELFEDNYLMVESKVYFEPYYHVLNVLKKMATEDFPMEKYIIRVETETSPPDYLLQIDPVFYKIQNCTFWPLNWTDEKFYDLNDAQHEAFKAAITNEFSIIQGPPGTGKTFLGLKIAHTLINNTSCWYKNSPMLVICYTNHALDQFLEGLLEVTEKIVRVGGQSKNEALNNYNIRNRRHSTNETFHQMRHRVRAHLQQISTINDTLKLIHLNESIVDFSVFSGVIPEFEGSWFSKATNQEILNWLFDSRQNQNLPRPRTSQIVQVHEDNNLDEMEEDLEMLDINRKQILYDDAFDDIISKITPLVSVKELSEKIQLLTRELIYLQENSSETLNKILEEERLLLELDVLQRNYSYFQDRLLEGSRGMFVGQPEDVNLLNPQFMSPNDRWHLYYCWLERYRLKLLEKVEVINREFRKDYRVYNEMRDIEDTQIMKTALVVGMTTTGAARLKTSLQALKCPIVIVEEAAEVLEAHIVCALTTCCKHLILIGDHQQLKPSTANFKVEKKYLLGISLFERMVINNIQRHVLTVQHRMRPEISSLIRPTIYPVLEDHESVLNRPPIRGLENCMYFVDHQEPEQLCKDSSKKNTHEADFLIHLAKHLVLNGHKAERITIIAAYLGQMFEMVRIRKSYQSLLGDVKITVLDNYQGEENDIVLLSLVRSNNENNIGFLKIENRVCVALSRARTGFYMMGNMSHLYANSDIWVKVKESLEQQNAIGQYLILRCQIHQHKLTEVKSAEDFMKIAEGGCDLMCDTTLSCGHICKSLCHIADRDHNKYKCLEKCNKALCNNEEHICRKLCYEECGPCSYPVQHTLECGHTVTINCSIDPATHDCDIQVKSVLPCGHEVDKPCFRDPETFKCPEPCTVRVEPCGHACIRSCHINADPDHLQYKCQKRCAKSKTGCSLPEGEKHPCSKLCCENCEDCEVKVKKERTICSHVYSIPCNMNVDEIECEKPCRNTLPCGHKCKMKCNEPCGNCSVRVDKAVVGCDHIVKVKCSEEPNRKLCRGICPRLLPCGHKCDKKCYQECTKSCKVNVECWIWGPCGHVIKTIECSLKETADPKVLLKHCTEKCTTKLKCGHDCCGTCGDCSQGRIHKKCNEKCRNPLMCNHECPIPCNQACKPCQKKCNYKCPHNSCSRTCGEPCNECKEPCKRRCEHQECGKLCGELCNVPPCYEPCKKQLRCGHACVGFCGDPCPRLCRICNEEELTDVFLGNEGDENARYVMLEECKHIFESENIEKWLRMGEEVMAKACPRCTTTITSSRRFSEYIKRNITDIINIKRISNGTDEENNLRRVQYLNELEQVQLRAGKLYMSSKLNFAIKKLKERLRVSKTKKGQMRRQAINKIDLDVVQSKLQIIDFMLTAFGKQDYDVESCTESIIQISFIVDTLMNDENHITEQEVEDIALEIGRLSRIVQYEKIQMNVHYMFVRNKEDIKNKVSLIDKLLFSPRRYDKQTDVCLQGELSNLNKLVGSSMAITELEKKQIVKAMGMGKGHWFKCPNGHYYAIGECGGANQVSRCNECGEAIGGTNHQLLPNQTHAREIDGSEHPAWSQAANMANYQL